MWFLDSKDSSLCVHQCKCKASVMHIDTDLLKYEFSLTLGLRGGRNVKKMHRKKLSGVAHLECSFGIQVWL